ncbi:TPA: hypothetical protein OO109_003055 [Legionella pneumophila]|nr:hypothetical protein [Legionella pneumophila]HCR5326762.1 hypothetical protein [Legionella pneumophila]HDV5716658.1 hypothetical protein [Legionella pneumophila]
MRLLLRAMVVSDEKSQASSGKVWIRKTDTSESLQTRGKVRLSDIKTKDSLNLS